MTEPRRPAAFVTRPPKHVLFVCVHNASRSQMAEAFARRMAPAGTLVWSAGTEPRVVHPAAIEAMREIGIELDDHRSKPLDDVPWREADTVVTLCGEGAEVCPVVSPDVRHVHWPLPDPSLADEATRMEVFREVRDEIRWRVASLWPGGE